MKKYNSEFFIIPFCFILFFACKEHDNSNATDRKNSILDKKRESFNLQKQKLENEKRKLDIVEKKQEEFKKNEKRKLDLLERKQDECEKNEKRKLDFIENKQEECEKNEKRKLDLIEKKQEEYRKNEKNKLELQIKKHEENLAIKRRTLDLKEKNQNGSSNNKKAHKIEKALIENSNLEEGEFGINAAPPIIDYKDPVIEEAAISEENNNIEVEHPILKNLDNLGSNEKLEAIDKEEQKKIKANLNAIQELMSGLGENNTQKFKGKLKVIIEELDPVFFKSGNYCIELLTNLFNRLKDSVNEEYSSIVLRLVEKTSLYNKKKLLKFYDDYISKNYRVNTGKYRNFLEDVNKHCN